MPEIIPQIPVDQNRSSDADKLDSLPWIGGFILEIDGLYFGVRCNDSEVLSHLRSLFPSWAVEITTREVEVLFSFLFGKESGRPGVFNYHLLYNGTSLAFRTLDLDEALRVFFDCLETEISSRPKQVTFLDAELVTRCGLGILILGPRDASKALAELLARPGESAWIDGVVGVTSNGTARMPTAMGRREIEIKLLLVIDPHSNRPVRPEKLGPGAASARLVVAASSLEANPLVTMKILASMAQKQSSFLGSFVDDEAALKFVEKQLPSV